MTRPPATGDLFYLAAYSRRGNGRCRALRLPPVQQAPWNCQQGEHQTDNFEQQDPRALEPRIVGKPVSSAGHSMRIQAHGVVGDNGPGIYAVRRCDSGTAGGWLPERRLNGSSASWNYDIGLFRRAIISAKLLGSVRGLRVSLSAPRNTTFNRCTSAKASARRSRVV